jgi:O-methyltransferase
MRLIRSVARRMLDAFGYRILPTAKADSEGLPPDYSPQMVELFRAVEPFTMTSPERIGSLVNAVEYVVHNRIAGEIVECGVWRGGSMMAVAHTLTRLRHTKKDLLLFDTFEGMPPPGAVDRDLRGNAAADLMGTQDRSTSWMWGVAQLDEVRSNMHSTQYPVDKIKLFKGRVENTIPLEAPEQISLLRLDTDWYESTKHELVHLFPKLSVGGVLIVDDYGHWEGARRAVDEYIDEHKLRILLCRIDYTGRVAVKQA